MTDIKEYLIYCIGRKATYINPDGLSQEVVILGITGYSENHKIIPHLRKLESLTEDEAKAMGYEDMEALNFHTAFGFAFSDIHYLTTIGIAWWATPEMWEKGLVIEVK